MGITDLKRMKIAMISPYDALDVRKASGTGFHMAQGLARCGLRVEMIGPLKNQRNPINIARYLWNTRIRGLRDHPQRDPGFLHYYAKQVEQTLRNTDTRAVLGASGLPLAYLNTDKPVALWTDSTFAGLLDYYDKFSNLTARTIENGHAYERSLFDRIDMAIFPSRWAADRAVNIYGFDRSKIRLISRGAGIDCHRTREDIERLVEGRPADVCKLLWVGVDWKRKGGDIALEAAQILNERGIRTELTIVGTQPTTDQPLREWVKVIGYLDKRVAENRQHLDRLFGESHFLILPTQAEAYGIVFCEASSYGLPSIANRTGGVPDAIREGVTGWTIHPEDPPSRYADVIEQHFTDPEAYRTIAFTAFEDFQNRTNWDVVCQQAADTLCEIVARKHNIPLKEELRGAPTPEPLNIESAV